MRAVRRTGDADQHHAAVAFGIGEQGSRWSVPSARARPEALSYVPLPHPSSPPDLGDVDGDDKVIFRLAYDRLATCSVIADRVAARQVGRNMTETLKDLKPMVEP